MQVDKLYYVSHSEPMIVNDFSRHRKQLLAFNGDITGWDTTRATTIQAMFRGADAFNQDIGSWNVAAATKCNTVFRSAFVFNQDLSNW